MSVDGLLRSCFEAGAMAFACKQRELEHTPGTD